jgi:hypothetical protein
MVAIGWLVPLLFFSFSVWPNYGILDLVIIFQTPEGLHNQSFLVVDYLGDGQSFRPALRPSCR